VSSATLAVVSSIIDVSLDDTVVIVAAGMKFAAAVTMKEAQSIKIY